MYTLNMYTYSSHGIKYTFYIDSCPLWHVTCEVWEMEWGEGLKAYMKTVEEFLNNMNMEKKNFNCYLSRHKPWSNVSFNAHLNISYISHLKLQQSMFLKHHSEHEVIWLRKLMILLLVSLLIYIMFNYCFLLMIKKQNLLGAEWIWLKLGTWWFTHLFLIQRSVQFIISVKL